MQSKSKMSILVFGGLILTSAAALANDVYIAQNAAGAASGSDCADAYAAAYFNTASNWTSGTPKATQIGPGTTVHLCGTFTEAPGATGLTFQGSGSNGNPITLLFEAGANLTSPYFANAITANNQSYLTINGQTNGSSTSAIANSDNGTSLDNQQGSNAIALTSCNNCTVENITIGPLYIHTCTLPIANCTDENGSGTGAIYVNGGSNVTINNTVVHDSRWCVFYSFAGGTTSSNVTISNNTAYNCDHGIAVGSGNANAILNGLQIFGNVIHDGANWDDAANQNHHDGIHVWSSHPGAAINLNYTYNNYVYGNWGLGLNSFIYQQGTQTVDYVFNNVVVDATTASHYGCGYICLMPNGVSVLNNTVIGQNIALGTGINVYGTNVVVENNVLSTMQIATRISGSATVKAWDYNAYFNIAAAKGWNLSSFSTWRQWKGDPHGSDIALNLSPSFFPTLTSAALLQRGVNLSGLAVAPLTFDKAGVARPSLPTGWDVGAYQFIAPPNTPAPPTGLTAVAH